KLGEQDYRRIAVTPIRSAGANRGAVVIERRSGYVACDTREMRKLALALAAVAGLVALYAAAGYWVAPRVVLGALQQRAAQLGATLAVKEVRTDPFALSVDLSGVALSGADGARLAGADAVRV